MLVTLHVAVVAYVIRTLATPSTLIGSLIWVPATISVAVFLSWPLGRAIALAFDPGERRVDRLCPKCGRLEVRPLIRPGAGLFQTVSGYRCAACWTTMRDVGESWVVEEGQLEPEPLNSTGIAFLSDPLDENELRFLDEPSKSPSAS